MGSRLGIQCVTDRTGEAQKVPGLFGYTVGRDTASECRYIIVKPR